MDSVTLVVRLFVKRKTVAAGSGRVQRHQLYEVSADGGEGGLTRFARPAGRFLAGSSSVQRTIARCRPPVGGSHPPGTGGYKRKEPVLSYRLSSEMMAVRGGLTRFARPAGSLLAGSSSVQRTIVRCRPPVGDSHPPGVGEYKRKEPVLSYRLSSEMMAVRGGFEPPIRCRIHTFQACSFSHSDTSPHCLPVINGTGANVGKTTKAVNLLFQ